jgi:predicted O-linked N-acetylglucosamine transferase (SPINDLY family)
MASLFDTALEHHRAGRHAEAEATYRRILAEDSTNADALCHLGLLAGQLGRNEEAVALIEEAHRRGKPQPASLHWLGVAYLEIGRFSEAKKCFARILSRAPDSAEAHNNLGAALKGLGEAREAERSYRRAVAIKPERADFHYNLGNLLREAGSPAQAEPSYRRAIALRPDYATAHNNLGNALRVLGRLDEAAQSYLAALALEPRFVETRVNLGIVLQELGRYAEAEQSLRTAVAQKPDLAEAHYTLGRLLSRLDRTEAAELSYRQAIALKPDFMAARWAHAMALLPSVFESEDQVEPSRAAFSQALTMLGEKLESGPLDDAAGTLCQQPFQLAYQERDNRELLARYGGLCARVMQHWSAREKIRTRPKGNGKAVRVGIVSAHIRDHSVWSALVKGWLQRLDPGRFEIDVYHLGWQEDGETAFAKDRAAQFHAGPKSLQEWAATIAERRPDVLIYPEIGMDITTARLASLRLARVQAASWGHPETTGLPTIDYFISAEALEPAGAESHYTEKLIRLPGLGCSCRPPEASSTEPDLARLGIDPESRLLVCPGAPFKYAPAHDAVLIRIAQRSPNCRLVFFDHSIPDLSEKLKRRLIAAFARAGLDFQRHAVFVPRQPRPQFYGLMRRAHVYLDTIGFSGFNTAMQAVECALPIVTCEGRFLRGRLASGILRRAGLDDLVAGSDEQYVALAARLAGDEEYRARMADRVAAARGALYDDPAPVDALGRFVAAAAGTMG